MRKSESFVLKAATTNAPWLWRVANRTPWLRSVINRYAINRLASAARARPHPRSLWGDHISWTGMVDRTYTGRHLPPAERSYVDSLPTDKDRLKRLFARNGEMLPCPKSSALFGFFAQWFTDSFLRTDPADNRKNTSNHEIDLCQIYGLNAEDTRIIRGDGKRGELEWQDIGGEEYPPFLFEADGIRVKQKYLDLSYIDRATADFKRVNEVIPGDFNTRERKARFFVTGLERGNSTVLYSALNTVFLREHNRLCRLLDKAHPAWSSDRLFETARNINIAQILKIIIEDYINHLSPAHFKLFVEVGFAETKRWYRTNRICAEFNLLYRWHQLVPTELKVADRPVPNTEFRFNNDFLLKQGLETLFESASTQAGGRISLKNTASFLTDADLAALQKSRDWRIQPYTAYLEWFGVPPVKSFKQLTGDEALAAELEALYGTVDRVEFPIGLLAEQRGKGAMLGDLMTAMVAVDAFSQALTNPLLSQNVYGTDCFSEAGLRSVEQTSSLAQIVGRTTRIGQRPVSFALRKIPGNYRVPLFGLIRDTADIFLFSGVEKFFRRRQEQHGSTVFRINFFQPTIAMLDHRAISALFASKDLVQEKPSNRFQFQIPPLPLVGNVPPSMFGDGDAHDVPKRVYQRLLRQRAATLVADFRTVMAEFTGRWEEKQRFSFRDEIEDFVVTFVFRWMLGANPPPGDVRYLYNNIFSHWAIAWTRYLPFSGFRRSLAIYRRLLEFVQTAPKFEEIARLAAAEGLRDRDVLAKHLCFVLGMNSFLGTQNLLKSIVGELYLRPELCDKLRPFTPDTLPLLDRTLREILRLHPPVFFVYGRATRDRVIESASGQFAIAEGDLVLGVIPMAQRDPDVFDKPDEFRPERFLDPRASEHLIWPRGPHDDPVTPEGRTCPGKDVALLIAKLFCAELLPNYDWKLDEQPQWSWRFTLNVAAPKGPLAVSSFRRRDDASGSQADAVIREVSSRRAG